MTIEQRLARLAQQHAEQAERIKKLQVQVERLLRYKCYTRLTV